MNKIKIISISGYLLEEKINIVEKHIWSRILKENRFKDSVVSRTKKSILKIVYNYTRKLEVHNLDYSLSKRDL